MPLTADRAALAVSCLWQGCAAKLAGARVQESMRAAEAASTEDCPVKMKLVAPPLYVLTTHVRAPARALSPPRPGVHAGARRRQTAARGPARAPGRLPAPAQPPRPRHAWG